LRFAPLMSRFVAFIIAFSVGTAGAHAETIVLRPDPCPAAAEQPLIIDLGDVELFNEDPDAAFGRVLVIYPPVRDGWASAHILMRFDLEPTEPQTLPDCRRPRLFQMPR
jgi:hypothetical protein